MRDEQRFAFQPRSGYALLNNVWNDDARIRQAITWDGGDGETDGWVWSDGWAPDTRPASYPNLLAGTHPWGRLHAPGTRLPCRVDRARGLAASFSLFGAFSRNARANVAFDLWILTEAPDATLNAPKPGTLKAEIMIWLNAVGHGVVPHGDPAGSEGPWRITRGRMGTWDYVGFQAGVSRHDLSVGVTSFALSPFVSRCVRMGAIAATDWIACVELGTEIWAGDGNVGVTAYRVV